MQVQPYLFFEGRCEEALEFCKKALSAKVDVVIHYKDTPRGAQPTAEQCGGMIPPFDKVIYAAFHVGETQILAPDGMAGGRTDFRGFELSVSVVDNVAAKRTFKALGDGGHVIMPMSETFFAHMFGVVTDRFDIAWMVIVPRPM